MVDFLPDTRNKGCGQALLGALAPGQARVVFFDPQYRGVLDRLAYGNEGARQQGRALSLIHI